MPLTPSCRRPSPFGPQVLAAFQRTLHRHFQPPPPPPPTVTSSSRSLAEPACASHSGRRPGPPESELPARPGMCAGSCGAGPLSASSTGYRHDGPEPAGWDGWAGWEAPYRPSDSDGSCPGALSAAGAPMPMAMAAAGWGSWAGASGRPGPSALSWMPQSGPGTDAADGLGEDGPGL